MEQVIKRYHGHKILKGKYANQYRNNYELVNEQYYRVYLTESKYFIIDIISLAYILNMDNVEGNPTWTLTKSNKVISNNIYLENHLMKLDNIIFFKNNKLDFRLENLKPKCFKLLQQVKILEYYKGHIPVLGCSANKEKNPYWLVEENDKKYYIMFCEKNTLFKFSLESLDKIKNITWFNTNNGYIAYRKSGYNNIYLHQHLMDYHGNGKGQLSVDHINRDKLDNRLENLRITTQSIQNSNQDKRKRKCNARKLPKELENIILPKYVNYNKEEYKPNKFREYFRIEKHPKLKKIWSSSKSIKLNILDKLKQTKEKLYQIENDIVIKKQYQLPKYCRRSPATQNIKQLIYDNRNNKQNLRYKYNSNITFNENKNIFINKIYYKYNIYLEQ